MEPITTSGWYKNDDGTWQYHWWKSGQLLSGTRTFSSLVVARLVQTLAELESISRNTPHDLQSLGYTSHDLAHAIQAGEVREVGRDTLETVHNWR